MHIILSTRVDPRVSLAQLQGKDRVLEPQVYGLRSTDDEQPGLHTDAIEYIEEQHMLPPSASHKQPARQELHSQPPSQALLDPLSTRELEVLQLMAQGASNIEIANALVIAFATVKRHVSNILSKLQATNRTQAVAYARQLSLLH